MRQALSNCRHRHMASATALNTSAGATPRASSVASQLRLLISEQAEPVATVPQIVVGGGIGDRGRHQIGEVIHPRLRVGWHGFGCRRPGAGIAPYPAVDEDRDRHDRLHAQRPQALADLTGGALVAVHPRRTTGVKHPGMESSRTRVASAWRARR
jgi:hypothetical protein